MQIETKILDERMRQYIPKYATNGSAAVDLHALLDEELTLYPGMSEKVRTGIAININDCNVASLILPRSGLGSNGLVIGNLIGLIDSDYQGELIVCAWNRTNDRTFKIKPFERIAQMVFIPVIQAQLIEVSEFSFNTERGENGFGSSGV